MAPTLELYERAAVEKIPTKSLPTKGASIVGLELESPEKHDRVLKVFRAFIADLCQQFNGGHPGSAMGMAAIGIALYKYVMRYSPNNSEYFNRDRFVLSNGHACLWQYLFMHLVGVKSMTLEQLKSYNSTKTDSLCPGHPEIENEGVEVTTSPLGQGVANAVGLAMATKNLDATYNKPGYELVNNMTWCMIGDACLQEGVGLEAVSLAVGYVVFEPPSNMILVRTRPSLYLPAIMVVWGVLTCIMSVVQSYRHLIILRVFVGVMESGFAPGILLIFSSWYKRGEQSKRFAVFMYAAILSGAFGGLLAGAITGGLEGAHGIRGWRWLFIVEGVATIGWAIVAAFLLLDFPANTKHLTDRERAIAIARLQEDSVTVRGEGEKVGKMQSFMLALRDWRTWGFIFGYMVIVGSSTLSYFYPTLVHGLGYTSTVQAQYMTVPIYAVAFVCTAVSGYFADKISNYRGLVIAGWLSFSMITSIAVCVVYDFTARYALLVLMAAGLWASNAISLSFASSTFGSMDAEVRAVVVALMNALGNLAQIYGAYLFPSDDAPKYLMGFGVISGMLGFGVCVYIVMHVLVRRWKP